MRALQILLLLTLCSSLVAGAQTLESRIVGNWACVSGPCPDPEIQFEIDGDKRIYNSWLHERPSASGGSWKLDGRKLSIECCARQSPEEWVVMRVSVKHLHLRPAGSKESAVFRRLK